MQEIEDTSIKRLIHIQDDSVLLNMTLVSISFNTKDVKKKWTLDETHMLVDIAKQMVKFERERA